MCVCTLIICFIILIRYFKVLQGLFYLTVCYFTRSIVLVVKVNSVYFLR